MLTDTGIALAGVSGCSPMSSATINVIVALPVDARLYEKDFLP